MAFYYNDKPLSTIFLSSNFLVLCVFILMISESATSYTLDLIHRDSPSSPFYDPSHTRLQRQTSSFRRSVARSSSSKLSVPITPFSGEYLAKFRIGTPPVEVLAIVDTHSDLTWTQCLPCRNYTSKDNIECYKQKTPLFDPTKSKTYRNLTCETDQCALLDVPSPGLYPGCNQEHQPCAYYVFYKDGTDASSRSGGDIAIETLTFDDSISVDLVFGCGHDNTGEFVEKASGVLGLGRAAVSIVNQLANSISGGGGAKYFSYCLTSDSDSDSDVSSKIRFGSSAIVAPGPKVVSTPLRNDPRLATKNFYSVTLEGISVGNQRLEYTPKTLKRTGNIVIDSSTAMTVLTTSFYDRLESVLAKAINGTTAKRVPDPRKANGLCYENVGQALIDWPTITAHLDQGADLVLSNENTFLKVGEGVFCLTFVRGDVDDPSVAIFGNIHQRNILIGFDLDNHKVDFLPTDCTKP